MTEMLIELSPALQRLVDARLDNIERALLSTDTSRNERRQIVAAVEDQIQELISRLGSNEPTREEILQVLASIDPPEAYGDGFTKAANDDQLMLKRPRPEPREPRADTPRTTNVLAIVSICLAGISYFVLATVFAFGIFSFIGAFVLSLPATILGIIALCQIMGSSEKQTGLGLAITGIVSLPSSLFLMAMLFLLLE
jgi:hypothetical protein